MSRDNGMRRVRGKNSVGRNNKQPVKSKDNAAQTHPSHHKWNVDGSDDVDLGVADGLLRHKDKSFGVQGINFGPVLHKSYIFSWPVLPGVDRTLISFVLGS